MAAARKGRELQRYDGDVRLLVGCVPVMPTGKVILISGRRGDLMFCKGGSSSYPCACLINVKKNL